MGNEECGIFRLQISERENRVADFFNFGFGIWDFGLKRRGKETEFIAND